MKAYNGKNKNKMLAAGILVLALIISVGIYCHTYNMTVNEENLIQLAEEHMEKSAVLTTEKEVGNRLFVGFEAKDVYGYHGIMVLNKGLNGRWTLTSVDYFDAQGIIYERGTSPSIFGPSTEKQPYTAFFSNDCPEEIKAIEITYYDQDAYMEDGSIIEKKYKFEVESPEFIEVLPVGFDFYDRDYRFFDEDGNVIPQGYFSDEGWERGNSNGWGSGDTPDDVMDLCLCVIIIGVLISWHFFKKKV